MKVKAGWSRNVAAGFIMEDVRDVHLNADKSLTIMVAGENETEKAWLKWTVKTADLNLRETEELIKYLEKRQIELEEEEWKRKYGKLESESKSGESRT
ncbi:MAG: hypothetical protein ACUVUF_08370 [Candidatus Bathycorpusculaceae bacterium]